MSIIKIKPDGYSTISIRNYDANRNPNTNIFSLSNAFHLINLTHSSAASPYFPPIVALLFCYSQSNLAQLALSSALLVLVNSNLVCRTGAVLWSFNWLEAVAVASPPSRELKYRFNFIMAISGLGTLLAKVCFIRLFDGIGYHNITCLVFDSFLNCPSMICLHLVDCQNRGSAYLLLVECPPRYGLWVIHSDEIVRVQRSCQRVFIISRELYLLFLFCGSYRGLHSMYCRETCRYFVTRHLWTESGSLQRKGKLST